MKKIILFLFFQILTTNLLSQNYWLLSSSFAGHFEFFAYSKKNPDLILYGSYQRLGEKDEISIVKIKRTNDSLCIEFPNCLKSDNSLSNLKYKIIKMYEHGAAIKIDELQKTLEAYLYERKAMVNPIFTVCKSHNELKKYIDKDLRSFFKGLIKQCNQM